MKLELVTLTGTKLSTDIYEVIIPTTSGQISVLPDHEPLVTILEPGAMYVRYKKTDTDDQMEVFATFGGAVETDGKIVTILADEAESGSEIVEAEAKAAYERAKKQHDNAKDQVELEEAKKLLDRHATRLKVAGLRRRHHNKNR
ncbi:ATP synthase epsilon chain [Alphaproteobacteria bacterium]|nr:ATP synthase epsilon chain [Alphaproteobacteria bacterium]